MSCDDGSPPSSPSILPGLSREKKRKLFLHEEKLKPESYSKKQLDKEVQVRQEDIMDCAIYKRNRWDSSDVRAQVNLVEDIHLCSEQQPNDQRNKEFAKLLAFELDRVPQEKRTMTYSKILDFVRKIRQEDSLGNISLPSFDDSDNEDE